MGFDDANFQEPPDKAEYEAYEKEEKRKLSECCCPEGDFRFCHGEKDRLLLQVDGLQKKLWLTVLANGGQVRVDKDEAELLDLGKYELTEWRDADNGAYWMRVGLKRRCGSYLNDTVSECPLPKGHEGKHLGE